MKRNVKRFIAAGVVCIMLFGMNITAAAVKVVPPEHQCAYSYMGMYEYQGQDMGSHPYYISDALGNVTAKSCHVTLIWRKEVWKCACGKIEYKNEHSITRHSACGLGDCQ